MSENQLKVEFEVKLKFFKTVTLKVDTEEGVIGKAEELVKKDLERKFGEKVLKDMDVGIYGRTIKGNVNGKKIDYYKDYGSRGEPYWCDAEKEKEYYG